MSEMIYKRNGLRLEVVQLEESLRQLLAIPAQYRSDEKIEKIELRIFELEAQISELSA